SSCFLTLARPPRPTLFPYTTLFRSREVRADLLALRRPGRPDPPRSRHLGRARLRAHRRRPSSEPAPHRTFLMTRLATALAELSLDRKSTRLNSSHVKISYAVFCLKK